MALTPTEKQRRYRANLKQKLKAAPESTHRFLKQPFFEYLEHDGNWIEVEFSFDMMGVEPPVFDNDSGPKSISGSVEETALGFDHSPFDNHAGSIGRAEVMVGCLLDAAGELANIINSYKTEQINARIAELDQADLTKPAARKEALADIVRLTKIRERLTKRVRFSIPEWKVKGV